MIHRFADPAFLLLLLLLVPALAYRHLAKGGRRAGTLRYPDLALLRHAGAERTGRLRHVPLALRLLALGALIVAFARPQSASTSEDVSTEGVDIVMALDISSSMLAQDLAPNRLEAAKEVAADFVERRRNDRIGLVVFAGRAFTQAPLTIDHPAVSAVMAELEVGMVEDGTAIGLGLATALKRLESSQAESRLIVLLTDGRNNRGEIDPATAAQMARALGVRVYTIGAGSRGTAPVPVDDPVFGRRLVSIPVDVDEPTLTEVAEVTGGRYFRATDRESLERIYEEIDALETTEIDVQSFTRYGELFHFPLAAGLGLLLLEIGLAQTVLRRLP
ncbi:MAG: VWA domain-containing protein [Gemmatimonadales bacterium]|nr:VWA domain-containing protein [Gemmatimonadales bacterium]MYG49691.1 VWA domain-containing protein [Gemmatimonadales bacterium]MYK01913.1 VWA domain-containing protein [Candidatus Palauibacter ramosifaciens]